MNSCEYILLIAFIAPSCLDWVQGALLHEEALGAKFVATEDTERFFKEMEAAKGGYGMSYIERPDGNGTAHFTKLGASRPFDGVSKTYTRDEAAKLMTFHYYSKGSVFEFKVKDLPNIVINSSKPIKVICHGWMSNSNSSVITEIRDAYLSEQKANVIGVDWGPISKDYYYPNSAGATEVVGKVLGEVIDSLAGNHSVNYTDIHLIGHSLGAHIVGFAGNSTRQKVGRITGLDPALPGFQYVAGPEGRLDNGDAQFVDVIHTCSGVLGISIPVGHVDFYPNGGSVFQPGCGVNNFMKAPEACSHSRSHQFFAESIYKSSDFESVRCQDWDHFKRNKCDKVFTLMGEKLPRDTQPGVYYLKTNWQSPFSQGPKGTKF